jgi:protein-disulfide isomerase
MNRMRNAFLAVTLLALAGAAYAQGLGRVDIGAKAPDFSVVGADGKKHSLKSQKGKVVVLEWTSPVCPYTQARYDDKTMQTLQKDARANGVVWWSINTTGNAKRPGYLSPKKANERTAKEGASPAAFLIDNGGKLGRLYGARNTPSFFIVGKDGKLLYQGAIDDDAFAEGKATRNHVKEALADITAGRPVRVAETRPYGCAVEY